MQRRNRISSFRETIIEYTKNNSKEYILVILIFIIGVFVGVMFINNSSTENGTAIVTYISDFIEKCENIEGIDKKSLLIDSIKSNIFLTIIIWFAGTTIIGIPVVLGIILIRGFCLGYTISALAFSIGVGKSIIFCLLSLFLQNIFFIPALLTMGVSSIKLYKAIVSDFRRDNIKIEMIRHISIVVIMLGVMIFASFIESEISLRLLQVGVKYIITK